MRSADMHRGSGQRDRCLFAVRRNPGGASKPGDGDAAGTALHRQLVCGAPVS
jgi:hypothetical protein